jgi:hypothetical protein
LVNSIEKQGIMIHNFKLKLLDMVKYSIIFGLLFLINLSCTTQNKKDTNDNQVETDIELLRKIINIPFEIDSATWQMIGIGKAFDNSYADYLLLAVISSSSFDEKDIEHKSIESVESFRKDSTPKWFIDNFGDGFIENEASYVFTGEVYEADLFYKTMFLQGCYFIQENQIFLILNTT